jgi:tetratricopeptide (TPR) repeat protein
VSSELVRRLQAISPDDASAVFACAAQAMKAGLETEALPLLEAATARHPGDARLWQMLGLAHRGLEDLAPAVDAFEKSAALAPADPLIAHSHARCALEAGLPSIDLFDRAERLAPGDEMATFGRLSAQLSEGRIDDAIDDLEARLSKQPAWLSGHASLCRLRWLKGERDGFASSFEAAVAAAPRDLNLWREWADALMHANQYEGALALVARGRAAAGAHILFDAVETIAMAEQGRTEEADRLFAALGTIGHVTMAARYMRHLLRAGRPDEAARFGGRWINTEGAELVWPYIATAWRLTSDKKWQSLEGDERLVGVYDLADQVPLEALAETLRGLHLALGQPLEQSVRGGTQTDGSLFSRIEPEIRALRAAIVAAVETHIAQLPRRQWGHPTLIERRSPVRFAGSWSVRLPGAGFHSNHIHPAGWLSSAFYVSLPDAMGADQAGWLKLGEPQAELGIDLAPFRTIEPKPGRLVLFPSTMWHGTIPFAEGERLTVAFDVAKPPQ